jgi:filamentous hemagglutinin family protein
MMRVLAKLTISKAALKELGIAKATNWRINTFISILTTGFLTSGMFLPVVAQVTSDGTTNTIINLNGNNFNILNGIDKGNNLFHSFSNFSVPTGGSARFDLVNTPNITTIFSRVTGGNVSNIDGLIQTLNGKNAVSLFLMNPKGIMFGQNAKLDIGGSFIGTTANSIKFADGVEFSAVSNETPLLTMSVPVGLQIGPNSGAIAIKNTGHNLIAQDATFAPYINRGSANTLKVKPNQTLAFVGGDIQLNGGILNAEAGRIDLASLREGEIALTTTTGFTLDNIQSSNLGNIQLSQRSLVDVSGANAGSVKIMSDRLTVKDGSVVMGQNRGLQPAGDISVKSRTIELIGAIPNTQIRTSLMSETLAGNSGNIKIETERLKIADGAAVFNRTFGLGNNGVVDIKATESIDVTGVSAINPNQFSTIGSATFSPGSSGNIQLSTKNLSVLDGGIITTTTFSTGYAGSIKINSETTQVAGVSKGVFAVTTITASTFGQGNAGNVNVNTQTLSIKDSGSINTTSHNRGNSGDLTINATKLVELNGGNSIKSADLNSSVLPETTVIGRLLRLPQIPTGNAGNITINTPSLKVSDLGNISVRNAGTGSAGKLQINANSIFLENVGRLVARSNSGNGGNIVIQANSLQLHDRSLITTNASGGGGNGGNITLNLRDLLMMRRGSQIDTESLSLGNGGNITINSPIIASFENSDINANSIQGNGGNIEITTQGIFGLKYRNELTPESDITASSKFGVNGTVDINNFGVNPNSGLIELPENINDPSQQIASGCSANQGSSFVATGRGGIPENPSQDVKSDVYDGLSLRTWSDIRDISTYRKTKPVQAQILKSPEPLVQATGWYRNAQGKIELVTDKSSTQVQPSLTCAGISQK